MQQSKLPVRWLVEVDIELEHGDDYVQDDIEQASVGTKVGDVLLGLVVPHKIQLLFHRQEHLILPKHFDEGIQE